MLFGDAKKMLDEVLTALKNMIPPRTTGITYMSTQPRITTFARFYVLAGLAAILAGCAAVQPAETVGPNDPAALAAIRAAYVKAGEQKSFRARMTGESNGKLQEQHRIPAPGKPARGDADPHAEPRAHRLRRHALHERLAGGC